MTCDECDQKSTCSTYKNQFESGYYLVNEYRKVEKKEKVGKLTKTVVVDELVPVGKVNASLKTHSGHCPIYKSHIKFVKHVEEK